MKWFARYGLVGAGLCAGIVSVLAAEALRPGAMGWQASTPEQPAELSAMPIQHCKDARLTAERLLCDAPDLASMALLTDRLFASHFARAPGESERRAAQREHDDWKRRVRDTCTSAPCLRSAYRQRLAAFGFVTD